VCTGQHRYTMIKHLVHECEALAWMLVVQQALVTRALALCASTIVMHCIKIIINNKLAGATGVRCFRLGPRGVKESKLQRGNKLLPSPKGCVSLVTGCTTLATVTSDKVGVVRSRQMVRIFLAARTPVLYRPP
jgi:hypothetical protein